MFDNSLNFCYKKFLIWCFKIDLSNFCVIQFHKSRIFKGLQSTGLRFIVRGICWVGELKDWTKRHLWSKTTLIASSVSWAGVNPPTCKMGTFFLMSLTLTLTEPSLNNFQLNGGKWPSLKLWTKKIFNALLYIKKISKFWTWPFTSILLEIVQTRLS